MNVYRASLSTLWITLQASEELGLIIGNYLQDYFGNVGQVSLYHVATDTYYPMIMTEVVAETPEIPHDVFRGAYSLATLPDGLYEIRGRVRDVVNNYTILSSVQAPIGGERIVPLQFTIKPGHGLVYSIGIGGAIVRLGITAETLQRTAIEACAIERQDLIA